MNQTDESIRLAKEALGQPLGADVMRNFTIPTSATQPLVAYDLAAVAHAIPVITPLRSRIPRDVTGYGSQANWDLVTSIDENEMDLGLEDGKRGGTITHASVRKYAAYVELGIDKAVTWGAEAGSRNYLDLKAEAQRMLLWNAMIKEEFLDLGGCGLASSALGQTPTPSTSDVGSGGSLTNGQTYLVGCVALTARGARQINGTNMGKVGQSQDLTKSLVQTISRTNADGTSTSGYGAGVAKPSATASQACGSASDSITATVADVKGAVAYAWYFGQTNSDGMYLYSVTAAPTETFTAVPSSSRQKFSALSGSVDGSYNALEYDGVLTQIMQAGNYTNISAKLTTDSAGGITEINTVFQNMYDKYRTGPDIIYMGSQQLLDTNTLIIKNGGAPLIQAITNADNPGMVQAGIPVGHIWNKLTNKPVPIAVHPNMPAGVMLFWSDSVPYPINDLGILVRKKLRYDYRGIEWPAKTRSYEFGVYFDGVLQVMFPGAFYVLKGIKAGV